MADLILIGYCLVLKNLNHYFREHAHGYSTTHKWLILIN